MNATGAARPSSFAGSTLAIDIASAGASTPIESAQVSMPPSSRRSRFTPRPSPIRGRPRKRRVRLRAVAARFDGKRAIVSGAAHGIGAAGAARLQSEGAEVGRLDVEPGVELVADVRDERAVEDAFARFGTVDVVVANAGVQLTDRDAPVDRLDADVWRETIDVNLTGMFLVAKH